MRTMELYSYRVPRGIFPRVPRYTAAVKATDDPGGLEEAFE